MTAQRRSQDPVADFLADLDLASSALLLDVDGTLIDIGPTPDDVHVPDELRAALARIAELSGGAVALVSGRLISAIDNLFAPLKLSAVGAHGAELRVAAGPVRVMAKPLPDDMRHRLTRAATSGSGVIAEDKGYSIALHFRAAPKEEERLRRHVEACVAAFPSEPVKILPGKAMIELKRAGIDKATGVRALMAEPPFKDRTPVFIGDDVTDEAVFAALPELKGLGFSVDRHFTGLAGIFDSPADVRAALARLAANGSRLP